MMRNGLRYSRNACQKLISGYTSCLQKISCKVLKMLAIKWLNNFEIAEVIKSCIFN